jgi:hypothetical protein
MDLTEAFAKFLEPSARHMTAADLNASVGTFLESIGGFQTLLTLLASQTEDAAEDLLLGDIMRRTAARVFSAQRGLDELSSDATALHLVPLISSAPEPVLRLVVDGLKHCLRHRNSSAAAAPEAGAGASAGLTPVRAWGLPDAVYRALLDRCRSCDADVFNEVADLVATDSAASEVCTLHHQLKLTLRTRSERAPHTSLKFHFWDLTYHLCPPLFFFVCRSPRPGASCCPPLSRL